MADCIQNRYDFVVLFDVENGNPNGDPDAGNMPRVDPETNCGLVTDVCLKRKIRNYVETVKEGDPRYGIYIKENEPLNRSDRRALAESGYPDIKESDLKNLKKSDKDIDAKLLAYMCEHYFDIRTFGAVMTTFVKASLNCGQVRGPVQLGLREERGSDYAAGGKHHPRGDYHRGGRRPEGYGNGAQVHRAVWAVSGGGLRFGQSGAQDDRLLGGRPEASVAGYSEYVRKRSQRGAGQNGRAQADRV